MIVRDPLYGIIKVPDDIAYIYRSRPVQRLRFIEQVGFGEVVYPSCRHNRLEHSLGVYALAAEAAGELGAPGELVVAALLHDVGHGPFSHVFENIHPWYDHEEVGVEIVLRSELRDTISDSGYDPRGVAGILSGTSKWSRLLFGDREFQYGLDRLDYLNRDGYHALGYKMFESDYLLARLRGGDGGLRADLRVDAFAGLYAAVRRHLYLYLYLHPARALYTAYAAVYAKKIDWEVREIVDSDPLSLTDNNYYTLLWTAGWNPYTPPPRRDQRIEIYEYGDRRGLEGKLYSYSEALREYCPDCIVYGVVTEKVEDKPLLLFYAWLRGTADTTGELADKIRRYEADGHAKRVIGAAADPIIV